MLNQKLDTFTAFVDFKRAFALVDRDLLIYEFMKYGISGRMYNSFGNIYIGTQSKVRLNMLFPEWFDTINSIVSHFYNQLLSVIISFMKILVFDIAISRLFRKF